jgi:hypothetical protein
MQPVLVVSSNLFRADGKTADGHAKKGGVGLIVRQQGKFSVPVLP